MVDLQLIMLMVLKLLLTMVDHQLSWDANEVDDVVIVYLILARVVCVIRPDDGPVVMRIIIRTGQLIPNRGGENDNNNKLHNPVPAIGATAVEELLDLNRLRDRLRDQCLKPFHA